MAVAPGLVDLGVLLALVVLIGLSKSYAYTLGALIRAFAGLLDSIRLPGIFGGGRIFGFVADDLRKVDDHVRNAFGVAIEHVQSAWNEAASWTAYAFKSIGEEIANLSHDTAQSIEGLAVRDVPKWFRKRIAYLSTGVATALALLKAIQHLHLPRVERITKVVTHEVKVVQHAIALPGTDAIPKAIPKVGRIEHELEGLWDRVKPLYKLLTVGGIIGLVGATIFDRFGLGWLRCKGVGRVGRHLCGLSSVIEQLAADALDVILATHLCQMVTLMTKADQFAEPFIERIVLLTEDLIKCQKAEVPTDWAAVWYAPPPAENLVTLAG